MQQQLRREYPTEIVEAGGPGKAFGRLAHASSGCVAVRLNSASHAPDWLKPGRHVVVSAGQASGVNHLDGRVWTVDGGVVWLYVSKPGSRARARRHVRRPCTMPVAVRWLRSGGIAGLWLEGSAVDVSIGGIGITIPAGVEATSEAEVRFLLPNEIEDADAVGAIPDRGRSPVAKHPIAAVARPAFVKRMPGDLLLVGFEFVSMNGPNRMRIAAFAHATQASQAPPKAAAEEPTSGSRLEARRATR